MNSKQEAVQQIAKLEAELKKLKEIVEAPEKEESLLTKPVPGSGEGYFHVVEHFYDGFTAQSRVASNEKVEAYTHGNFFQTKEIAQAYAEAFDTLLLLRHCEGSVVPAAGPSQYVISYGETRRGVYVDFWGSIETKFSFISPCFKTERFAEKAIQSVGEERIVRMFKTLHGVYE